ncbi:alpha/beta fold hydrolase [Microbacterium sp. lyk4-40-TSB-66]|uniref:alpha/beta fold hydrolase n=1 Tax=Microbacterium sp. lyk4-40-TSB-66 TaxID=3040294 RepID=UPI00254D62F7|nr:alpha/beta fold hydrolase [Microbacterium sp. lyk4-40-TSB-66]
MPHTPDHAIFYDTAGDAADPTVVLIAGGGAQLIAWHVDLVAALVGRGLHVVRMDNRDVGLSARFGGPDDIDGGYGLEEMGDDVIRVLDDLGVEAGHLVGHSMGGMMAQMVAIRHPARVRSLGLLSTIPGRDPRYILHDERPELMRQPVRYTREDVRAGAAGFAASTAGQRYPLDVEWNAWAAVEAFDRGYAPEGFSRQWSALLRAPERLDALRAVDVPALVFHGRDDDVLHWSAAVDMAEALTHAELQVHSGMGHYIVPELWPELVAGLTRTVAAGEARGHS